MYPTRDRASAGYLVDLDGTNLWMDAGSGTFMNLQRSIDFSEIGAIVLTHRHPDHVTDVFQAFHAREFGSVPALEPIPMYAPQQTIDALLGLVEDLDASFVLNAIQPGDKISIGSASLRFVEMVHPPDTVGVRIELGDASIAYTADTGPTADLADLAGGVDLFVCEATLQGDETWEGHLNASQAGEIAAQAGVGKLVLSHLPPAKDLGLTLAQAQATCGGIELQLADDGQRHDVR
jgi:ribonuclease BN (tRNA processing enzyme)